MNNRRTTILSAIASYAAPQVKAKQIDPYTRMSIGLLVALCLSLSENQSFRSIGIGIGIAAVLQLLEINKGGRITRNHSTIKFYILDEHLGVTELQPGQIPKHSVDGLTCKGLNGIFKVSDGVYLELEKDNRINYSFGFGKLINQSLRSGAYKSKQWVDQQTDLRWKALYLKSIH